MPLTTQAGPSTTNMRHARRPAARALLGASLVSAGLILASVAPAAHAASAWHAPVDLAAASDGDALALAVAPGGGALALWEGGHGGLEFAARPAGAPTWKPGFLPAVGAVASEEQVATDAAGTAIAVWTQPTSATTFAVLAAVRPAGGSFSAPVSLSAPGEDAQRPQVAMNATGDAVVGWQSGSVPTESARVAVRPSGGSFGAPLTAGAGESPQVGIDRAANVTAVFIAFDGSNAVLRSATRPAGGSFTAPVTLSAAGRDASYPDLAVNAAGDAVAGWHDHGRDDGNVVETALRPAGGSFAPAVGLTVGRGPAEHAQVAIDDAGDAIAVWQSFRAGDDEYVAARAAIRPAGGAFGAPVDLAGAGSAGPDVAMNAAGDAVAVWTQKSGKHLAVRAAVRHPGGAFSSAARVSSAAGFAVEPRIAIDAAGRAVAAWQQSDPKGNHHPQAAVYEQAARRPALTGLRVQPAAFRAATSGGPVTSAWALSGGLVTYAVDPAARVRFTIERRTHSGYVRLRGGFSRGAGSRQRFKLTGRLAGRRLAPGSYRLVATPTVGRLQGKAARRGFRIAG